MSGVILLCMGVALTFAALRWSHRAAVGEHRIALVVTLGVLAAAYNVVVPIPNVEATTLVVVATALTLGPASAVAVALVAVVGTSSAASVGLWTIWQIVACAGIALIIGTLGAVLGARARRAPWLLVACLVCSVPLYDIFTTVTSVLTFGGGTSIHIAPALIAGLPFYVVHLVSSAALAAVVGPSLVSALDRARPRLDGGRIIT